MFYWRNIKHPCLFKTNMSHRTERLNLSVFELEYYGSDRCMCDSFNNLVMVCV